MCISALFTIGRTWIKPECPLMDEWLKKMWPTNTMDYYSAFKKSEILPYVTAWMNLKDIMLNKISQLQRDKHCTIPLNELLTSSNPWKQRVEERLPGTRGKQGTERAVQQYKVSVMQDQ